MFFSSGFTTIFLIISQGNNNLVISIVIVSYVPTISKIYQKLANKNNIFHARRCFISKVLPLSLSPIFTSL